MRFDGRDKAAPHKLDDDFAIDDSNEVAVISGDMKVEIVRPADDQFRLRFRFPGGEDFDVRIARAQLLEQLNIGADQS